MIRFAPEWHSGGIELGVIGQAGRIMAAKRG